MLKIAGGIPQVNNPIGNASLLHSNSGVFGVKIEIHKHSSRNKLVKNGHQYF